MENPISIIEGFVFPAGLTSLRLDEKLKPFIPRALLQRVNRGTLDIVYNGATRPQKKNIDFALMIFRDANVSSKMALKLCIVMSRFEVGQQHSGA